MTKTRFYKTATLAMTLSMVVGSVSFASTQPVSKTSSSKTYSSTCVKNNKEGLNFKSKLDGLVTAGTITQTQENAIVTLATTTINSAKGEMKTGLDGLVTAGTITQAQEDAVVKLATPTNREGRNNEIKVKFNGLVTAGTITQSQENAMINALTKALSPLKG